MGRYALLAFIVLLVGTVANPASACSYAESPSFRESLSAATTVFIFRLESATLRREQVPSGGYSEWVEGSIRVVQNLKGRATFRQVRFSTEWCGGVRLDVGHYFVIAARGTGKVLQLVPDDRSVLDISEFFSELDLTASSRTPALAPIVEYLRGTPLPPDYPPSYLADPTSTAPMPNNSLERSRDR